MGADLHHDWLIVGCVIKPHGVHGDVVVEIISDFPERLQDDVEFGLGPAEGPEEFFHVHRVRLHKKRWLLSIKDIRSRETIEAWRGRYVFLPPLERQELPEGYYYEHELVGLQCRSPGNQDLGTVTGLDTGSCQTRLRMEHNGREHLVPWVGSIITEVDLESRTVTIDAPAGLLDDDAEIV